MKVIARLNRIALAAATGLAVLVALSTTASADHGESVQSFNADHTDYCVSSVADGLFTRVATHPPALSRVEVDGTLEVYTVPGCWDLHPVNGYAEFTAFGEEGGAYVEVDHQIVSSSPSPSPYPLPFEFSLDATAAAPLIEFVELRTCIQRTDTGVTTCGITEVYVP